MSYVSEVAADSPTVYYPLHSVSSGVWPDSSGNGRDLDTTSGTAPTLDTTSGPDGLGAMVFGASTGHIRNSVNFSAPTVGTYEAWVYLPSSPSAEIGIAAWTPNSGSNGTSSLLRVRSDGKISSYTEPEDIVSSSALSTGAWHHIVASWGAAGHKIRIDKSTVATGTQASGPAVTNSNFRLHGFYFPSSDLSQTGAIRFAHAAFYPTQLTDARTDAHYDAMFAGTPASGAASLSLSASGTAAAASSGSASLSLSASGAASASPAGSASLTFSASGVIDFEPASGSAALSLSASGAAGIGVAGTAALDLSASGTAAGAQAASGTAALTFSASGSATLAAGGTAVLTLTAAGEGQPLYTTDTSNALDGLDITFVATASAIKPPPPAPVGAAEKYDLAIAYPTPVMVGGRPT